MNRMYLTCRHHPTQAESFLIGDRVDAGSYSAARNDGKSVQKWLDQHATCGGGFDHFTVSYALQKDGDIPTEQPLANAVHATLRVVK